ncbi:FdtA/QdtA family cupin domain-containing protein [bacterium]|nr:FdtA/QdtA family cupin domain-containing protein [bacterium]
MANILKLQTHKDERGKLTVIEKLLPFEIKRVYYIYETDDSTRGGHRHKKTYQAAICISGSCTISCQSAADQGFIDFDLSSPDYLLIINPEDYHIMSGFSKNTVLLVLASEYYDPNDYINEKYGDY